MSLTHSEICERLSKLDEISLLEVLEINSEDLVNRFEDVIELKRSMFEEDLEGWVYHMKKN